MSSRRWILPSILAVSLLGPRLPLDADPSALRSVGGAQPAWAQGEPSPHPGYKIYKRRGCSVCHGRDLRGSRMAPSLTELAEHYDREKLARYLANPDSAIAATPRLAVLDAEFDTFEMPAFELPKEEFEPLASLLLDAQD